MWILLPSRFFQMPSETIRAHVRTMIRVLLVEDDVAFGRALARALSRYVDIVDVAADVPTALRRLELDAIDVVVTDFDLGLQTGLDLNRQIRERWPHIPVILASGSVDTRMRQRAYLEGVKACFDKPVELARLVDAIRQALSGDPQGRRRA